MRGKLGLVSRFVPFSPATISGLTGWWDASDSTTLFDATTGGSAVAADGGVARLEDKSGNGRNFTQSTGANQPARKTAIQNSLDVLRFDGNDRLTSSVDASTLFSTTATTCFVVAKATTVSSNEATIFFNTTVLAASSSNLGFFVLKSSGTVRSFGYDGFRRDAGVSYSAGDWIVLTTWHDGAVLSVSVNGGAAQTTTLSTQVLSGNMKIGEDVNGFQPFNGDLGEIITYNQTLSAQDRGAVESALLSKWAIS